MLTSSEILRSLKSASGNAIQSESEQDRLNRLTAESCIIRAGGPGSGPHKAGGFTAEQHDQLSKLHADKAASQYDSRGERQRGIGGAEKQSFYHADTHDLVSKHYKDAANALRNGDQAAADNSARLARYHEDMGLPHAQQYGKRMSEKQ